MEQLESRRVLASFLVNTTFDTVDVMPGDGSASDAEGKTSLRAAIMEANALGGENSIVLPSGTYGLSLPGSSENASATGDLDVTANIRLIGGGAETTVIDAKGLDRVFDVRGTSDGNVSFEISRVTVTGGLSQGGTARGGGILGDYSNITVVETTITGNRTAGGISYAGAGGGIYVTRSTLSVDRSTISDNTTGDGTTFGGFGGGIGANVADININESVIRNNRTGDGPDQFRAGFGGGIDFQNGMTGTRTLTIDNTIIADNQTGTTTINRGGGIRTSAKTDLYLRNSSVTGNRGADGGGISLDNGTAQVIRNSTIANNESLGSEGGGGIHVEVGHIVLLEGTTISGNTANQAHTRLGGGGGIFNQGPIDAIINSTFSGNATVGIGGGIANRNQIGKILNTTIAENSANIGGGMHTILTVGGTQRVSRLENTIVANNTAAEEADDLFFTEATQLTSAKHNLIEDPTGNHGLVNGVDGHIVGSDPVLGSLQDNGGPTETQALLSGSPAIDAGLGLVAPATDQRGAVRPAGNGVDIGAFELTGLNSPPVANDLQLTIQEDESIGGVLPGEDTDEDALVYARSTMPAHGIVSVADDGRYRYVPDLNYSGTDSFTYSVTDPSGATDTGTVSITISAVNDAPYVDNPTYEVNEDETISEVIQFIEVEGDPVTFTLGTPASHGSASMNSRGGFTYSPNPDFHGSDSFTFIASDDAGAMREGTVSIEVLPVNDAPVASDNTFDVEEGSTLSISVSGMTSLQMESEQGDYVGQGRSYSYDPSGATFSAKENFDQGISVDVETSSANDYWFLDFAAPFSAPLSTGFYPEATRFPFQASDEPGLSVSGQGRGANMLTGQFTVYEAIYDPAGDVLAFAADFIQYADGSDASFSGRLLFNSQVGVQGGVLANDSDVDGDLVTAQLISGPSNGTLQLDAAGTLTYTPNPGFSGTDTFTYQAFDGQTTSTPATVTINVNDINYPPQADDDAATTDEDTAVDIDVLANDSDLDKDALAVSLQDAPANGTAVVNPDGTITYTPEPNFFGTDSFVYSITDEADSSDLATVRVTVESVNDAPVAENDSAITTEGTTVVVDVLSNDSDLEGDPLEVIGTSSPSNGAASINPDGTVAYTPDPGFIGTDNFTYTVQDTSSGISEAMVTVNVVAEDIVVSYAVKPGRVNLAKSGNLTVQLWGTESLEGSEIDAASIRYLGATAVYSAVEDLNEDGYSDLELKFSMDDLRAELLALYQSSESDDWLRQVETTLEGHTLTETSITASESLELFVPRGRFQAIESLRQTALEREDEWKALAETLPRTDLASLESILRGLVEDGSEAESEEDADSDDKKENSGKARGKAKALGADKWQSDIDTLMTDLGGKGRRR